jgi:hypothetical protein
METRDLAQHRLATSADSPHGAHGADQAMGEMISLHIPAIVLIML